LHAVKLRSDTPPIGTAENKRPARSQTERVLIIKKEMASKAGTFAASPNWLRGLLLSLAYSADDESGAERECEKEEKRSQQNDRIPQLTYHWNSPF